MSRIEEVKKSFPEYVDLALKVANPKHKNKYLMWIASQLASNHPKEEIQEIIDSFHKESKRLSNSDIYSYKDFSSLASELQNLDLSKRQKEQQSKDLGSKKIYEDDVCTLIRINSKLAMLYYGKASKWCISMEKEDYWEEYSEEGNIFYILIDKSSNKKFAIQKEGFLSVSVWEEKNRKVDINRWAKDNEKYEKAIFACLQDREDPVLFRMKIGTASREEIIDWIKYQSDKTMAYIKNNISEALFYLVDLNSKITPKTIEYFTHAKISNLELIKKENSKFFDELVKFLVKNPDHGSYNLRLRIANLIPDPEVIVREEDASFIKAIRDPSLLPHLLRSKKAEIWKGALNIADSDIILHTINEIDENKKHVFLSEIESRISLKKLIIWLAGQKNIQLPPDVFCDSTKTSIYYGVDDDLDDDDDDDLDDDDDDDDY